MNMIILSLGRWFQLFFKDVLWHLLEFPKMLHHPAGAMCVPDHSGNASGVLPLHTLFPGLQYLLSSHIENCLFFFNLLTLVFDAI